MLLLYSHWILPGRLRRVPRWMLLVLLLPAAGGVWLIVRGNSSPTDDYTWFVERLRELTLNWTPALTSLFGLVAGALSIASERQKQRWEPLILTRLKLGMAISAACKRIQTD